MPLWGRTDNYQDKPKFPVERFEDGVVWLTANATPLGNVIYFAQNATANVSVGAIANGVNTATTIGFVGFNLVNGLTVLSKTSNSVVLSANTLGNINAGQVISFTKPMLAFNGHAASAVNANTIFVTASRMKTANVNGHSSVAAPGHVHVKTGSGLKAGRIQYETLVCLSNGVAFNTQSGGSNFPGL